MNFKPTKAKIIISILPLILYLLVSFSMQSSIENPFVIVMVYTYMLISIPLVPVIKNIGFANPTVGAFWPITTTGIFMVAVLWGIIIYVVLSIFSKNKT